MKIGNAVGTAPFKNTNRKNAKYTRKANRRARAAGFVDAIHRATFTALLAARIIKQEETK